jgi:hypothetical protein
MNRFPKFICPISGVNQPNQLDALSRKRASLVSWEMARRTGVAAHKITRGGDGEDSAPG